MSSSNSLHNERKRFKAVLLTGLPGCGKGTQASLLHMAGHTHLHHMSAGDLIREADPNSAIGTRMREAVEKGTFVQDEDVMALFDEHIVKNKLHPDTHTLLLDGFPPKPEQVPLVNERVDMRAIVHLTTQHPEMLVTRAVGRAARPYEASETGARERLERYRKTIPAMLALYPKHLVHEIDATGSPENPRDADSVHTDILRVLREHKLIEK